MKKTESLISASRFYLSGELPSDFEQMEEGDLNEFIISHTWCPFEDWSAEDVWELIEDLASEFYSLTNPKK